MDCAHEHAAYQHPKKHREPSKHHGHDGAGNGSCAADRAKLMGEGGETRGGSVGLSVLHAACGGESVGIYAPGVSEPSTIEQVAGS